MILMYFVAAYIWIGAGFLAFGHKYDAATVRERWRVVFFWPFLGEGRKGPKP